MEYPEIPGYKIESEVGVGGMGVVYRARHLALERTVALKIINPKYAGDQEFVTCLSHEAKIVARLSHPNIVSVYDFGSNAGTYYLSMQYVVGTPLKELLAQRRPRRPEIINILKQVAAALDYAHREEIVHRDVKPGNILLCLGDKAMVIDFGVAHGSYSASAESIWKAAGTRTYMSPEQCKGQPASPRSDQYSVGVVAYEMLTGKLPFVAEDPAALRQKILSESPPPLRLGRTDITPRIEAAVLRALSKVPEMRFPTVTEFVRELQEAFDEAEADEVPVASAPRAGSFAGTQAGLMLLTGAPVEHAPRATPASGYVYATRGGREGRGISAAIWMLILLLIGGIGAGGYAAYLRMNSPVVKAKPGTGKNSPRASHRKRRARRSDAGLHTRYSDAVESEPFSSHRSSHPDSAAPASPSRSETPAADSSSSTPDADENQSSEPSEDAANGDSSPSD